MYEMLFLSPGPARKISVHHGPHDFHETKVVSHFYLIRARVKLFLLLYCKENPRHFDQTVGLHHYRQLRDVRGLTTHLRGLVVGAQKIILFQE